MASPRDCATLIAFGSNFYQLSTTGVISLCTKFELPIQLHQFQRSEESKIYKYGLSGSLKRIGNFTVGQIAYDFLLAFHSNYGPIFCFLRDIARY